MRWVLELRGSTDNLQGWDARFHWVTGVLWLHAVQYEVMSKSDENELAITLTERRGHQNSNNKKSMSLYM